MKQKIKYHRLTAFGIITGLYLLTPFAVSAEALLALPQHEKLLQVRPTLTTSKNMGFKVQFITEATSYVTDEPIRFQIKANKRFYLYLFNVSPITGEAVTLLPNRLQNNTQIQYDPDQHWHTVPNPTLEFYSDRPGLERIIMVASTRYLDVDKLKHIGHTKSAGDFYQMETPFTALNAVINEAYRDKLGREKLIQLRNPVADQAHLPDGLVIKEMQLKINPALSF